MPHHNTQGNTRNSAASNASSSTQINEITAPYNFTPIADTVVEADWYPYTSHDYPLRDGYCGTISFTLTSHTPLLVGGIQTPASKEAPGEVHFYQTPDKKYAIPGSSLRGMIRSVFEIATYSQLRMVDDKTYGLRDISGKRVSQSYSDIVGSVKQTDMTLASIMQAGFLQRQNDGSHHIIPCRMVHVEHETLDEHFNTQLAREISRAQNGKLSLADKYKVFDKKNIHQITFNIQRVDVFNHRTNQLIGQRETAYQLGKGNLTGQLVMTGQPSKNKKRDFIFYNRVPSQAISIDGSTWRDFLFIHDTQEADAPWSYWKKKLHSGEEIPVFYSQRNNKLRIGLAYMPKLAGDFSTHDLIRHTSPRHLDNTLHDMATTLFGYVGESSNDLLKGRLHFDTATLIGTPPQPMSGQTTILNSPKPSYFPNYLQQQEQNKGKLPDGTQYATYIQHRSNTEPKIRGFKRYPVRDHQLAKAQKLLPEQENNKAVQVTLHPLPAGISFTGRIHLHNLKPQEIGALLWCLQIDTQENQNRFHRLGMGKSFGYGQVRLHDLDIQLTPNNPQAQTASSEELINSFMRYMDDKLNDRWINTPAIRTLTAMTDPAMSQSRTLEHMTLTMSDNPFNEAKKSGLVLKEYPMHPQTQVELAKDSITLENASISIERGKNEIIVKDTHKGQNLSAIGKLSEHEALIPNILKRIKNRKPTKTSVIVEKTGNQYIIQSITDISQ